MLDSREQNIYNRAENESQFPEFRDVHDVIPLSMLATGLTAQVVEVMGGSEQVQRIKELGLQQGAELQMVRSGSPCIVRLAGQTLCFRAAEMLSVLVQPRLSA